jgi:hypothetical protein
LWSDNLTEITSHRQEMINLKELLKTINEKISDYKVKRTRSFVLRDLKKRYDKQLQIELLMEEWIIKRIRDGQVQRRKELAQKQAEIKEIKTFINFFKEKI